jgi:L,D-peptidoglycan transpeptidase YkuD (ErfK/YbiS/YcfS/YnhG family)
MRPILKKKGSAIFIHITKNNYKKTEGCVALKKADLIKVLKRVKKNTYVKIENQK